MDASTQNAIAIGNTQALEKALKAAGLGAPELQQLKEALREDGDKKLGSKVGHWITENASKVVVGGVKIGKEIGQKVLTEWLMQHYGLK